MPSGRLVIALLALPGLLAAADASPSASTASTAPIAAAFERDIKPLLSTYCFKCHGPDKQKAEINFAVYTNGEWAINARKVWKLCNEKVGNHEMPPEKETKQPTEVERERFLAWIRALRDSSSPDPGRVAIHRLNRTEYNNTVRDLIGLDLKPAANFPEDDVGDGFDNIALVLAMPPLLMEKYLIAADQILDKATVTEQANFHVDPEQWTLVENGKEKGKATAVEGDPKKPKAVRLDTASEIRGIIAFPESGKYTFKIRAWGEQAGTEPVDLGLKIDDRMIKDVKVPASRGGAGSYSVTLDVKRGIRSVALAFINPFEEVPPDDKAAAKPPVKGAPAPAAAPAKPAIPAKPNKVRAVGIELLDISGAPVLNPPPSHKRIFFVRPDPKAADIKQGERDAAKQIIERFATQAYRRPVSDEQLTGLLKVYDVAAQQGEVFAEAVRLALKGVLISPSFLFRVEQDRKPDANGVYHLDDWEIASRLSYFLWSTMPDEELFAAARDGKLHEPADVQLQAARMLKDPKAKALPENFSSQWLELRKLNFIEPDATKFAEFTKELRKALYDEVIAFVDNLMREDRSVLEFLDADYAFINDRLAKHYGLPAVAGGNLRKVPLPDHNRGGVLGMGGILAITSLPNRTSPVKRGKWVLDELLADPPPPPPPMVPPLEKQEEVQDGKKLTNRERLERHRVDPGCAGCHQRMDPIGFGLENFDAIGRWRDKDGADLLDTNGKLPSGQSFAGPVELKGILMARKEQFVKCLIKKLLTYALGRGVEEYDESSIEKIDTVLAQNQYKFSRLIGEIVISYPFLNRKAR